MKYPYKYVHHDVPIRNFCGDWKTGTEIYASKQICLEMLQAYKKHKGLSPFVSLHDNDIWLHEKGRRCAIIISCISKLREEAMRFPHRKIAAEITKAWRVLVIEGGSQI